MKVLRKLARKNDADLLMTYSSSFNKSDLSSFDEEAFVEGCEEIAKEYLENEAENPTPPK